MGMGIDGGGEESGVTSDVVFVTPVTLLNSSTLENDRVTWLG